jgi:hypothetical protein
MDYHQTKINVDHGYTPKIDAIICYVCGYQFACMQHTRTHIPLKTRLICGDINHLHCLCLDCCTFCLPPILRSLSHPTIGQKFVWGPLPISGDNPKEAKHIAQTKHHP